ncbi:DUF2244 domain-containing protein [Lentibacter algarum]|uniref:DUF2244 domain-containing protein n=1 Tax=Lentibacter algarum TaxID=576131 RepID=UPI001C071CF0|nr:DUF2244 domain-containing protein [Lentibacter algarum]MBU2980863.1 DUF2244 domain-containing protein [Lentibacter algarum]
MPYSWSRTSKAETLTLRPHRSLPIRGFAIVFLSIFLFAMIPLFGLIGTSLLWGMLPFVLLTLSGLYWAFMHTYRTGDAREVLHITAEQVTLTHTPPKGPPLTWECNTHWARAQIYVKDGPVPHYITLAGNGREVELGSFLSEDERKQLIGELKTALKPTTPAV